MPTILQAIATALSTAEPKPEPTMDQRVCALLGRSPQPPLTPRALAAVVQHAGGMEEDVTRGLRDLDAKALRVEAELNRIASVPPGQMRQAHLDHLTARPSLGSRWRRLTAGVSRSL